MTWEDACASVIQNTRQRDGIGRLREKTVHAVIKAYLEEDPTRMEQKVGSFWADILREDGSIVEIQTGNFYKLSRKLEALLPQHKVEVVYPVIVQKKRHLDSRGRRDASSSQVPQKGMPIRRVGRTACHFALSVPS